VDPHVIGMHGQAGNHMNPHGWPSLEYRLQLFSTFLAEV